MCSWAGPDVYDDERQGSTTGVVENPIVQTNKTIDTVRPRTTIAAGANPDLVIVRLPRLRTIHVGRNRPINVTFPVYTGFRAVQYPGGGF
jgi:hypothetical protein